MKNIRMHLSIIVLLLVIGTFFSFVFYREVYYTAIQIYHSNIATTAFSGPLLQNRIVRGELTAQYDNFGTVKIRINTYGRFNYDTIHFRLREKGTQRWNVTNTYYVDKFPNRLLYGFGFPPFENSEGKTYEFELYSDGGTPDNSVGFISGRYSVASQYVYSKHMLIRSPDIGISFFFAKLRSLISDPFFVLYYVVFLLPGIVYVCMLVIKNILLLNSVESIAFAYMLGVYMFIPISITWDTILYIILMGIFVLEMQSFYFSQYKHQISGRNFLASHVYHLPMILIGIMVWNIAIGDDLVASRTAIGVFYLTLLSLILSYRELVYTR